MPKRVQRDCRHESGCLGDATAPQWSTSTRSLFLPPKEVYRLRRGHRGDRGCQRAGEEIPEVSALTVALKTIYIYYNIKPKSSGLGYSVWSFLHDYFRYITGSLYLTKVYEEKYWREVLSEPNSRFLNGITVVSCPMIPVQSNAFTVATGSVSRDWTRLLLAEKGLLEPEKRRQMLESTG